jgi:RNA polymerase sigma-70 factor (ECF subfamily)
MDPNPTSQPDRWAVDLVRRAQAGDRAAFDQLARHYRGSLLALAFLRTSDMEAAEDLVQDVLTRAWQKLPTLQEPASFVTWLRTIVINACRSWYRRSPPRPLSLEEGEAPLLPAARGQQPLERLLDRERQRELRQALVALPEANRLALMMHVWGDYSYKEIALFTGVELTTVEGRIHRAKRQLRQLLRDEGAEFLGEPRHRAAAPKQRQRRTPMTQETVQDLDQPLALVLFSYRLATLLDSGISLLNTLDILQQAPSPYGEASRDLLQRVEQGGTLSQAMADKRALFSDFYRTMVRAGEVTGILEEMVRRVTDLMTREWTLARFCPEQEIFLINPSSTPIPADWAELSSDQQTVLLALLCEAFGMLLDSGVPILQAMEILAELLPPAQREGMRAAREAARSGERISTALERLGILPRFAIELMAIGEEAGRLDVTLDRAAGIFRHELECKRIAGGSLHQTAP